MRRLFAILVIVLVATCAFVAGAFVGVSAKLPTGVTMYKGADCRCYLYENSPGNLGEIVADKDFDNNPEHWVLLAQENKATVASILAHPQLSGDWASNTSFFSREPAKAFDASYWDDDGDERFDAFTFRFRGWCGGDACGGDGNVLLNVLDLDVDGYPETFACTIFVDSGVKGYNYSDIGFDGTWDLSMEFDGQNKRAFFEGTWCDILNGNPMLDGLTVKSGDRVRHIKWKGGKFIDQD